MSKQERLEKDVVDTYAELKLELEGARQCLKVY